MQQKDPNYINAFNLQGIDFHIEEKFLDRNVDQYGKSNVDDGYLRIAFNWPDMSPVADNGEAKDHIRSDKVIVVTLDRKTFQSGQKYTPSQLQQNWNKLDKQLEIFSGHFESEKDGFSKMREESVKNIVSIRKQISKEIGQPVFSFAHPKDTYYAIYLSENQKNAGKFKCKDSAKFCSFNVNLNGIANMDISIPLKLTDQKESIFQEARNLTLKFVK